MKNLNYTNSQLFTNGLRAELTTRESLRIFIWKGSEGALMMISGQDILFAVFTVMMYALTSTDFR